MDSKLRDKIAEALAVQGVTDGYICDKTKAIADYILSLLARELEKARLTEKNLDSLINFVNELGDKMGFPELVEIREKARKWDRVERAYNSSPPCDCPEWDSDKAECMIEAAHCPFDDVVDALSKEAT